MRFQSSDVRRVARAAAELAEISDPDAFLQQCLEHLCALLDGDVAALNVLDPSSARAQVTNWPDRSLFRDVPEALSRVLPEHPVVQHFLRTRDPTPVRIGDVMPLREFRNTRTYAEVFAPVGTPHMLAFPVPAAPVPDEAPGLTGYSVSRSAQDFSDSHCDIASLLQPALIALHRRLLVQTEQRMRGQLAPAAAIGVTPREMAVLALLATGSSQAAIGHNLGISPRTVQKHLERLYVKLGVHDRLLAVERARGLGLL